MLDLINGNKNSLLKPHFFFRTIQQSDLDDLLELTRNFNTINLPYNIDKLAEKIDTSIKSFSGEISNYNERIYIFALEDLQRKTIIGISQLVACNSSKRLPHISFKLLNKHKYCQDLQKEFISNSLLLDIDFRGMTELASLILQPNYRHNDLLLGKQLSFIRFIFLLKYPQYFQKILFADLMPIFTKDGKSLFWESIGKKFTGLDYYQAQKLASKSKEFIESLFPISPIPLSLLDKDVQSAIGKCGKSSRPAQKLLEQLGLKYQQEINIFDGGPHFKANIKDIKILQSIKKLTVATSTTNTSYNNIGLIANVGNIFNSNMQFFATLSACDINPVNNEIALPPAIADKLMIKNNTSIYYLDFTPFLRP